MRKISQRAESSAPDPAPTNSYDYFSISMLNSTNPCSRLATQALSSLKSAQKMGASACAAGRLPASSNQHEGMRCQRLRHTFWERANQRKSVFWDFKIDTPPNFSSNPCIYAIDTGVNKIYYRQYPIFRPTKMKHRSLNS